MNKALLKIFYQNSFSYADAAVIMVAMYMGGWHGVAFGAAGLFLAAYVGSMAKAHRDDRRRG